MPAAAQEKIKLKVIGQPLATGLIQKNKEQPFFETLAQKTGLPIEVEYKPVDTLGIKDTDQLRVMKAGLFEMASLRMSQNSRDEPTILGLDLVGLNPDYATGRKVADAFAPILDQRLQKQFGVKLLGIWPFGPQVLFCKKPIAKLGDVKGLKVFLPRKRPQDEVPVGFDRPQEEEFAYAILEVPGERLVTMICAAPSARRCLAASALILPAPTTRTLLPLSSPKTRLASSTATELMFAAPRLMPVSVRTRLATLKARSRQRPAHWDGSVQPQKRLRRI